MKTLYILLGDTFGDPVIHGIFTTKEAAEDEQNKRGTSFGTGVYIQKPDLTTATLNDAGTEFEIDHNY